MLRLVSPPQRGGYGQQSSLVNVKAPVLISRDDIEGEGRAVLRRISVCYRQLQNSPAHSLPFLCPEKTPLIKPHMLGKYPQTFRKLPRQQAVSAHIRPTPGPHGFHTGQMWTGSGPKICCFLGCSCPFSKADEQLIKCVLYFDRDAGDYRVHSSDSIALATESIMANREK